MAMINTAKQNKMTNSIKPIKYYNSALALIVLGIYLFVTAPPPLPAESPSRAAAVSIQVAMEILNAENSVVRRIYTQNIVSAGKKVGLKFDEHWEDSELAAGPLPAQFLRGTALNIEKSNIRLGLYLGSDYPINKANAFTGQQLQVFQQIRKDQQPRFFFVDDVKVYAYMFPDRAVSEPCIDCHNKHMESPKINWKLNEIMGATTWVFEKDSVTLEELLTMLSVLKQSVQKTYSSYLGEVSKWQHPPIIGKKWPSQGYYLPSVDEFMHRINSQSAPGTLVSITQLLDNTKTNVVLEARHVQQI